MMSVDYHTNERIFFLLKAVTVRNPLQASI